VRMEIVPNPEREENIKTVEQLQNTEVNMGDNPIQKPSRTQSHGEMFTCDQCDYIGTQFALLCHKKSKHEVRYRVHVIYSCDQCEYVATFKSHLKQHKESKHDGVRYPCNQCKYSAADQSTLRRHQKSKHEEVKYSCEQCEFIGSQSGLLRHKKSKHEGVRYPCDQCEYVATRVSHLKQHKESKHEGVRYPCDQCKYSATDQSTLKRHKKSKHEGVKFTCDQCEYAATRYDYLKIHKKKKHSIVSTVATKVKNDRVKIEKIDARKYQISPDGHTIMDPVVIDISNKNRAYIKSFSMDISDFQVQKENGDDNRYCDLQTKIEIEEDMAIKTESSDLSEFLDPSYKSSIDSNVSCTEIKKEENFENYDISDLCKSESDTFDLQTKIEIEEDMAIKTESSDLSEFLNPTYEESL